jgi:hypothetical protein
MTNQRKVGDQLENTVSTLLEMKGTRGSGAVRDDSDLIDNYSLCECKVKNTQTGITMPRGHIDKLKSQSIKWHREWIYVTELQEGDTYAILPIDWFAEIYNEWKELKST